MTSRAQYLLPLSILLMAFGLALPYALIAGLALSAFWFAATLLGVFAGDDAANIVLAGLIATAVAAWLIL